MAAFFSLLKVYFIIVTIVLILNVSLTSGEVSFGLTNIRQAENNNSSQENSTESNQSTHDPHGKNV